MFEGKANQVYLTKNWSLRNPVQLEPGEMAYLPESGQLRFGILYNIATCNEGVSYSNEFKIKVVGGEKLEPGFRMIQHPFKKIDDSEGTLYHHLPLTDLNSIRWGEFEDATLYMKEESNPRDYQIGKTIGANNSDILEFILGHRSRKSQDKSQIEKMIQMAKNKVNTPSELVDYLLYDCVRDYCNRQFIQDWCRDSSLMIETLGNLALGGLPNSLRVAVCSSPEEYYEQRLRGNGTFAKNHRLPELIMPVNGTYQSLIIDPAMGWKSTGTAEGKNNFFVLGYEELPKGTDAIKVY